MSSIPAIGTEGWYTGGVGVWRARVVESDGHGEYGYFFVELLFGDGTTVVGSRECASADSFHTDRKAVIAACLRNARDWRVLAGAQRYELKREREATAVAEVRS